MKDITSQVFALRKGPMIPQQTATDYDRSELTRFMERPRRTNSSYKPILMVMSDERNCREMGMITHTRHKIHDFLGFSDAPEILMASGDNSLQILSRNALWHLQKFASHYSAIVTLDPWVTFLTRAALKDVKNAAPIVFVGLDAKMANALIGSHHDRVGNITGVQTRFPDYGKQMSVLRDVRPTGSRIILPTTRLIEYEPDVEELFLRDYSNLTYACSENDFNANKLLLNPEENVVRKLKEMEVRTGDIVCIPVESPILSQAEEITEYCNNINATAYAFDLTAVARGAAMGTGSSGHAYAQKLAPVLYQVIAEQKHGSAVDIETVVENNESRYNEMTLRAQGIEPTARDRRLMELRSIFSYDE